MAEMATYVLFMVHTNDDEDTFNLLYYRDYMVVFLRCQYSENRKFTNKEIANVVPNPR